MQKALRWIGIALGVVAGLLAAGAGLIYFVTEARLNRVYAIPPEPLVIPAEADLTRRDWPLTLIAFCKDCHGDDLGGQVLESDAMFGTFSASNLTPGQGGVGRTYSDVDWVRALRHGVRPNGKPLVGMPSNVFNRLSDSDLGLLIAYLKTLPPVDREVPPTQAGPLVRLMVVTGGIAPDVLPAEVIDHDAPRPDAPAPGLTVEYGRYMAVVCGTCHGEDMSGGPEAGEGMNLTPGGALNGWTEEQFVQTLRTGVAPDGQRLDPEQMPWNDIQEMTDEQLRAIWLFLRSLPAIETEHR